MTINFKMWRFLVLVFLGLSASNFIAGWVIGSPMNRTLLIEFCYFVALFAVWLNVSFWLKNRVNEAWDKALAEALEPFLELRKGDYATRISEVAVDGSGPAHIAIVDQAQDPHTPTETPPRKA